MVEATVSSKNQIVIPREAREALKLKAGDKILIVNRGDRVLILQKPRSFHTAIRGLGGRVFSKKHIQKERESWG